MTIRLQWTSFFLSSIATRYTYPCACIFKIIWKQAPCSLEHYVFPSLRCAHLIFREHVSKFTFSGVRDVYLSDVTHSGSDSVSGQPRQVSIRRLGRARCAQQHTRIPWHLQFCTCTYYATYEIRIPTVTTLSLGWATHTHVHTHTSLLAHIPARHKHRLALVTTAASDDQECKHPAIFSGKLTHIYTQRDTFSHTHTHANARAHAH